MQLDATNRRKQRRPPTPRIHKQHTTKTKRPTLQKPKYIRIAFAGKICSGKTTMARYVQDIAMKKYNFVVERIGFGDFVKEMATTYFEYNGAKYKNRELLVKLGTSMRAIQPDVWATCLEKKIINSEAQHWVVDDVRHKNEVDTLRGLGFTIVRIDIPEQTRIERVKQMYPDTYQEHLNAQSHSTENELFDDTQSASSVVDHIVESQQVKQFVENLVYLQ